MRLKLIASDLDGTLLNIFHKTDSYILKTIDKVLENELHFVITTGRSMQSNQYQDLFKHRRLYRVLNNGALIVDPDNQVIFEKDLSRDFIIKTLERFGNHPIDFICRDKTLVNTSKKDYLNRYSQKGKPLNRFKLKFVSQYMGGNIYNQSHETIMNSQIIKLNTLFNNEREAELFNEHVSQFNEVIDNPFTDQMFEITDYSVNKARALKIITQHLQVPDHQVAVFGDGGNDIELLSEFKYSYAPSNAIDLAKSSASQVIGDYRTYAVPRKIRQILKTTKYDKIEVGG